MKAVKLSSLKKGEYFTIKDIEYPKENQVFIKGDYDRSEKAYVCDKFSDISECKILKGDKLVYTDFYFIIVHCASSDFSDAREYLCNINKKGD